MWRNEDELPLMVIHDQVNRLAATFGGKPKAEQAAFAVELQRATRGWSSDELTRAVTSAIAEEPHFPRIKAIRLHRAAPPAPVRPGGVDICEQCSIQHYVAGFELFDGTVHGKMRCGCAHHDNDAERHRVSANGHAMGWHTPAAKGWRRPANLPAAVPDREEWSV